MTNILSPVPGHSNAGANVALDRLKTAIAQAFVSVTQYTADGGYLGYRFDRGSYTLCVYIFKSGAEWYLGANVGAAHTWVGEPVDSTGLAGGYSCEVVSTLDSFSWTPTNTANTSNCKPYAANLSAYPRPVLQGKLTVTTVPTSATVVVL